MEEQNYKKLYLESQQVIQKLQSDNSKLKNAVKLARYGGYKFPELDEV
jgi:hypothetical protein